jgi:hypothetical protein
MKFEKTSATNYSYAAGIKNLSNHYLHLCELCMKFEKTSATNYSYAAGIKKPEQSIIHTQQE